MKDNQIYINVNGGKVKISYKHPIPFTEFLQIVSTGILAAMKGIVSKTPEPQKKEVTEDLYDMYNAAASNTLFYFAPEVEMRPHLTTQAILEAEDRLLSKTPTSNKPS